MALPSNSHSTGFAPQPVECNRGPNHRVLLNMNTINGYRLYVNLGPSQVRRRLKGVGFGVRKVETAGTGRSLVIHTATGEHRRKLCALFEGLVARNLWDEKAGGAMIAALDVRYGEAALTGHGAAMVFEHWGDAVPLAEYTAGFNGVEPYVPGQFFKREMPCLLALLAKVREPLDLIVVDGFVSLGDKPGLGMHLWEALDRRVAIIGVAKNRFRYAKPIEVVRGSSKRPLYITAADVDPAAAVEAIRITHGANRIPTLLKRVDRMTRQFGPTALFSRAGQAEN